MSKFLSKNKLTKEQPSVVIDEIISNFIKPVLKEAGYKKAGRTWTKKYSNFSLVINVQASSWNGVDTGANFVINYGVYIPSIYEMVFELAPPNNPKIDECSFEATVTYSTRGQIWWEVYDDTDIEKLGNRIVENINSQCLAKYVSIRKLQDIVSLVTDGRLRDITPSGLHTSLLYAEIGDLGTADKLFKTTFKLSHDNPSFKKNIARLAKHYGLTVD